MQSAILLNDPAVNQNDLKAKGSDNKFKIFAGLSTLAFIIGYVQLHMQVQYQQDVLDRLIAGLDEEDQDMMANSMNLNELTVDISNLQNLEFTVFEELRMLNIEQDSLLVTIYEKVLALLQLLDYQGSGGAENPDVEPPVIEEPNPQPFFGSTILTPFKQQELHNLFNGRHTFELAYRATEHGFDRGSFHSHVNGVGETITIAKNWEQPDYIFGGFTDINIKDTEVEEYVTGHGNSWQFFYDGETAHRINFKGTPCEDWEIYQNYGVLISWRDGIWITTDSNYVMTCKQSFTWFKGENYEWPDGCNTDAECGGRVAGDTDTYFWLSEIETWIVHPA